MFRALDNRGRKSRLDEGLMAVASTGIISPSGAPLICAMISLTLLTGLGYYASFSAWRWVLPTSSVLTLCGLSSPSSACELDYRYGNEISILTSTVPPHSSSSSLKYLSSSGSAQHPPSSMTLSADLQPTGCVLRCTRFSVLSSGQASAAEPRA